MSRQRVNRSLAAEYWPCTRAMLPKSFNALAVPGASSNFGDLESFGDQALRWTKSA